MDPVSVLIVEDDYPDFEALRIDVESAGYQVAGIAKDADAAIQMAKDLRPTVVLMDIQLGDDKLAGARVARVIRDATQAQIIFVTGQSVGDDLLQEVHQTGQYQFLTKPVAFEQLRASLQLAEMKVEGRKLWFLSYSRVDLEFAEELLKHIKPLNDAGIYPWIDRGIPLGSQFKKEIERALISCQAAICLISVHYVGSEFIMEHEWPRFLEAADARSLRVIPVFVDFVDEPTLKRKRILDFQAVNGHRDPIANWPAPKRQMDCWGTLCERLQSELR